MHLLTAESLPAACVLGDLRVVQQVLAYLRGWETFLGEKDFEARQVYSPLYR